MGHWSSTLFRHFEEGGWGMYPIVVVHVFALAAAAWQLRRLHHARRHLCGAAPLASLALRASFDVGDAIASMAAIGGPLARSIATGLAQLRDSSTAASLAMRSRRDAELAVLDRPAGGLTLASGLSTLFGLLGTLSGLVAGFGCVANADAASKATMLAKGISESMNCAAYGLFVAASCIALHALLDGWRERLRADADHALALLDAELDTLRPLLSVYGERIPDARQGYRGA